MTFYKKEIKTLFRDVSLNKFKKQFAGLVKKAVVETGNDQVDTRVRARTGKPLTSSHFDADGDVNNAFLLAENEKRTAHFFNSIDELTDRVWSDADIKYIQADILVKKPDNTTCVGIASTSKGKKMKVVLR